MDDRKAGLTGPDIRAGDGVVAEVLVEVEQDARIIGAVEGGEVATTGSGGAGASDLDVDALGVGLGAVGLASRVEGDNLVAEHVVSRGQAGGDIDLPGVAVGDQVVRGPVAGVGAGVEAGLGNLDPPERRLVNGAEVARDRGDVVNDGTVVTLGPGVPLIVLVSIPARTGDTGCG